MSDIILKFWPKEEIAEIKTSVIRNALQTKEFIGDETEYEGRPAFYPGSQFNTFFEPIMQRSNEYFNTLVIRISEKDYGVLEQEEDVEYIDRLNVIEICGGDGTFEKWSRLTDFLKEATGNEYQGGYELL